MELELESLAPFRGLFEEYKTLVRHLCQKDLTELISKHIGWKSSKSRDKSDWRVAGEILAVSNYFMFHLRDYTAAYLFGSCYELLNLQGQNIPETNDEFIFSHRVNALLNLSQDRIRDLVNSMDSRQKQQYEAEILGREIWESIFWRNRNLPIFWQGNYAGYHD